MGDVCQTHLGNHCEKPEKIVFKGIRRGETITPYSLNDFVGDFEPEEETLTVKRSDTDSVVMSVLSKFVERSKFGKKKYGTDLDRQDLSILDWIVHAQEEHMDAILYLEKLKQEIQK